MPGEDRFDQLLRLVRDVQACTAEVKLKVGQIETRETMREQATAAYRQETREAIHDLRNRFEAKMDRSREGASRGGIEPTWIYIAVAIGAGIGLAFFRFAGGSIP